MNKKGYVFINLMPYREEIKKEQIKQFSLYLAFFAIIAGFMVFVAYSAFKVDIEKQLSRNRYVVDANKKLSIEIQEIANLRSEISSTLAKRKVVEDLQVNRSDTVNILNDLSLNIPDGVILNSIIQKDNKLLITGTTNSNNKISNFMTSLASTKTFMNPELIQITANASSGNRAMTVTPRSNFSLNITMRPHNSPVIESLSSVMGSVGTDNREKTRGELIRERLRVK